MNNVEYYQVYDQKLNKCDLKIARPNHIPNGYYFGIIDVITYNKRNQSFLITKRSKYKSSMPGYLEVTVGCMQYGEDPLDSAKRELKEETGIDGDFIKHYKTTVSYHAIAHTFTCVCDIDPDSILLQEGETEAYYWYKEKDFKSIWNSRLMTPVQKNRIEPNLENIILQIKEMCNE